MISAASYLGGIALGALLTEGRERLPRSAIADVMVMAPLVALVAAQAEGSSSAWLRIVAFTFVAGRLLTGLGQPAPFADDVRGNLHLLPFLPALVAGIDGAADLWTRGKTLGELGFCALFITSQSAIVRWCVVLLMSMQLFGRFG